MKAIPFSTRAFLTLAVIAAAAPAALAQELRVNNNPVELRIGLVGDAAPGAPVIARVQLLPIVNGQPVESSDAPHLIPQKWLAEPQRIRTMPTEPLTIRHAKANITFTPATWTIKVDALGGAQGNPTQSLTIDPATGQLSYPIDGPLFGLGEGGQPHDRRGSVDPMEVGAWNNTPFPLNDWGEQLGIPWLLSPTPAANQSGSWGLYFHSPPGTFDLTDAKTGRFGPNAPGAGRRGGGAAGPAPTDAFIVLAREPAGLMHAWSHISGLPSLPPIWSMGYIQSHRELRTPEEAMQVAKTFREKQLPCDMLIYLGTGFAPVGWNKDHGNFEFNPAAFTSPIEQFKQLHDLNFRVALHVTPRGENPPRLFQGAVNDPVEAGAAYNANSMAQYWVRHAEVMKTAGIDAWWPDEGEGFSAAARLGRIRMYYEGPQMLKPDQRPYALHRTGSVGMQRYGGWLWSGDVKSNWQVLARHLPLTLNASVSASPFYGSDTGGFYQDAGRELKGDLFARWFQFSSFNPLFRSHGRDWWYRHLPWGFSVEGNPDRDPRIEEICRKYLDLRYQLMPYTYSLFYECHETGMPILRPLWLHYPQDAKAVAVSDQFLWGRDMLVAPVVEKGAEGTNEVQRKVYLPAGKWHDYFAADKAGTAGVIEGGREIVRTADLSTMPLYVRAGAIIPFGPKENYTLEKPNDPLTIQVYAGADGTFTMAEDDGVTISAKAMKVAFKWSDADKRLSIALEPGSQMRAPMTRHLTVQLIGTSNVRTVDSKTADFTGAPLEVRF